MAQGRNVLFVGVAREKDKVILCSKSFLDNSKGLEPVRQMLKSLSGMKSGQLYSFNMSNSGWHLTASNGLVFMTNTKEDYPTNVAKQCLNELQTACVWGDTSAMEEGGMDSKAKVSLAGICEKFNDLAQVSTLHKTLSKVKPQPDVCAHDHTRTHMRAHTRMERARPAPRARASRHSSTSTVRTTQHALMRPPSPVH